MEKQKTLVVPTRTTAVEGLSPLPNMQVEVHAIATYTDANVLPEPVNWMDVMRALLDGNEYNIVHFCGHLADQYLILAREKISIDGMVMLFRNSPPERRLIVINTCDSEEAALRIATATPCDVIYGFGSINNEKAINFATKFYSLLQDESIHSYREAFDASVGDQKNFGYLEGAGKSTDGDGITRGGSSETTLLRADLNELRELMTGGIRGKGIVWEIGDLKESHHELVTEFSEWRKFKPMLVLMYEAGLGFAKRQQSRDHTWQYILVAVLVGLLASLFSQYLGGN